MPEFEPIFTLFEPESAALVQKRLESTGGSEVETRIMSDLAALPTGGTPDAGQGQNSGLSPLLKECTRFETNKSCSNDHPI